MAVTDVIEKAKAPLSKALEPLRDFLRSPATALNLSGKIPLGSLNETVRAKPAIVPQVSLMIGMTASALGIWGSLFPHSVKRTLGVSAPANTVRALFGAREMWSGIELAADPTKAGVLWARVAADVFDIAVLRGLDSYDNPKRGNARLALGFVLGVTALDMIAAVGMSTVKRNSVEGKMVR